MSESTSTERWGIVEVMGHRVVAGRLGAQDPPYTSGIVVHVPMPDGGFAEEFYGGAALFGVRVVPEAVARRAAASSYHVSELAKALGQAALPAPKSDVGCYNLNPGESRATSREAIFAAIDERLQEPEYDEIVSSRGADWHEDEILARLEEAREAREAGSSPSAYRLRLRNLAAEVVAAMEAHDREQEEDEDEAEAQPADDGPDDEDDEADEAPDLNLDDEPNKGTPEEPQY